MYEKQSEMWTFAKNLHLSELLTAATGSLKLLIGS